MTDSQDKSRKNHGQIRSSLFRSSIWLSQRERGPLPCPPSTRRICPCVCCRRKCFISRLTRGGNTVNLPPSGAARTRSTATATADATEVTPILVASSDDAAAPVIVVVVALRKSYFI